MKKQRKEVLDFVKYVNKLEYLYLNTDYSCYYISGGNNMLFDVDGQVYVNWLPVRLISKEVDYYDTNFWGNKIKKNRIYSFLDFNKEEMDYIFKQVKLEIKRRENQTIKDRGSLLNKLNLTEGELNELKKLLK
jgi:hypothetical protein